MGYRLVCVALLALAFGQVHPVEEDIWGGRNVQRANMNQYTDYVLTYMAPIFRNSGLVPMGLPPTSIGWEAYHYDYETRVMGLGIFRGWVEGHMEDMVIRLDLLLDMFDFFLFLQGFRVTSIGDIHVRVRGNILTDWLANLTIDIVIFFFENTIVNFVSNTLHVFLQEAIDEVNASRVRFSDISAALTESLHTSDPTPLAKYSDHVISLFQKYTNV
uniref:Secreted protein n=1 Tax=Lutzomyia longipalpis TaxID=7200 RepID=A0A1B0CSH8_LUTLO